MGRVQNRLVVVLVAPRRRPPRLSKRVFSARSTVRHSPLIFIVIVILPLA